MSFLYSFTYTQCRLVDCRAEGGRLRCCWALSCSSSSSGRFAKDRQSALPVFQVVGAAVLLIITSISGIISDTFEGCFFFGKWWVKLLNGQSGRAALVFSGGEISSAASQPRRLVLKMKFGVSALLPFVSGNGARCHICI